LIQQKSQIAFVSPRLSDGAGGYRERLGSKYRSGRSPDWLKFKNPAAPAVRREVERIGEGAVAMKTRTHFGHRIDMLDREGEFVEHLAGVEDSLLADATYEAALRRWPKVAIILRQGARVIRDSRKPRLVK